MVGLSRISRLFLISAAFLGAIGVGIGAIGAHGLPDWLSRREGDPARVDALLENCETAVRYQMIHVLAVLAVALSRLCRDSRLARAACVFWLVGILMFSGGLYSIVFLNQIGHWVIVPAGGLQLIIGWCLLGICGCLYRGPPAADRSPVPSS